MVAPRRAARSRLGRRLTPRSVGAVRSRALAAPLGAGWLVGPGPDGEGAATDGIGAQSGRDALDPRDDPRSPVVRGVVGDATAARKDTFGLSRREREVLALIAEGRTNREIGERLFISQKTVGAHMAHIYAKLGVHSRVEAAGRAQRLGVLTT